MSIAVTPASALLRRAKPNSITLPTGVSQFDQAHAGLPRGAITEIYGPRSSGKTSFLVSTLAAATTAGEVCAFVDTSNSFDPHSAHASGVALPNLLWIRCGHDAGAALKAADILLHGGGFGVLCLDLSDVPPRLLNRLPASYWFRFRLAIENSPTALIVLTEYPTARSCATCSVVCGQQGIEWAGDENARLLTGLRAEAALRKPVRPATNFFAAAY
jgi:hypothetical protein